MVDLGMVKKNKTRVEITRDDLEKMKKNPAFSEAIENLEDIADLKSAKDVKGKDITLDYYLRKRGLRDHY